MSYTKLTPIEFNHCDPAGIVFYPRYFEMINSTVENFFETVVGYSFARMHLDGAQNGTPTVAIKCDFRAPSRLGEKVDFILTVTSVGRSSLGVAIRAEHAGELRLEAQLTLVWISHGRAASWPDEIRIKLQQQLDIGGQNG